MRKKIIFYYFFKNDKMEKISTDKLHTTYMIMVHPKEMKK